MKFELEGKYRIQKIRYVDGKEVVTYETSFPNLITNGGLDMVATNQIGGLFSACKVGTGNTPPAFTDTALAVHKANTATTFASYSTVNSVLEGGRYLAKYGKNFEFAMGAAAGNITEVGVGPNNSSTGGLFSRALVLDSAGNPTTITVLADEILRVSYELYIYEAVDDWQGVANIEGVARTVTIRHIGSGTSQGGPNIGAEIYATSVGLVGNNSLGFGNLPIFPRTQGNGGGWSISNAGVSFSQAAYVSGQYFRDFTISFATQAANATIQLLVFGTKLGTYQAHFNPPLAKTNTKIMSLTFRVSWGRYTP